MLISCTQSRGVYKGTARADFSAELLLTQPAVILRVLISVFEIYNFELEKSFLLVDALTFVVLFSIYDFSPRQSAPRSNPISSSSPASRLRVPTWVFHGPPKTPAFYPGGGGPANSSTVPRFPTVLVIPESGPSRWVPRSLRRRPRLSTRGGVAPRTPPRSHLSARRAPESRTSRHPWRQTREDLRVPVPVLRVFVCSKLTIIKSPVGVDCLPVYRLVVWVVPVVHSTVRVFPVLASCFHLFSI